MITTKISKVSCVFALAFLMLCDRNPAPEQSEYIAIGVLFPLTGVYCDDGIRAVNGVIMARNEINKNGGILGKKLDIIALNDKNDKNYIVEQYKSLKEKGVVAVIGSSFSGASIALANAAENDGIPIISPTASNPLLTQGRKNVFRVIFTDDLQAQAMARYARQTMGAKRVLCIKGDSAYAHITDMFSVAFKSYGGTVAGVERYATPNDFTEIFNRYKSNPPDIVYCPSDYITAAKLAEAAHETGFNKTAALLGADAWDGMSAFLRDAEAIENVYYTSPFSADVADPKIALFSQRYFDTYSHIPIANAALAYSAVQILAAAIEKTGGANASDIALSIKANEADALIGRIHYDEFNNPRPDIYIVQIKNGTYVAVDKINISEGNGE